MKNARYFDEEALDAGVSDAAVQEMARRQFAISAVVAVALLFVAGFMALTATQTPQAETVARHKVLKPGAPELELARPSVAVSPKG